MKKLALPMYADETRHDLTQRLSRVEGQIRGVIRMVEEDRPCAPQVTDRRSRDHNDFPDGLRQGRGGRDSGADGLASPWGTAYFRRSGRFVPARARRKSAA